MNDIYLTIAVEDPLSEAVVRKILSKTDDRLKVSQCLCKGGQGYLEANINKFNKAAIHLPFVIVADQDRGCPPKKISKWLKHPPNKLLLFRIAVMEIEAWIMAHRKAFAEFLLISTQRIPKDLDQVHDPKQLLLSLASQSKSSRLRNDILPEKGSTATVGPDYNHRLCQFVYEIWEPSKAQIHSSSLKRSVTRFNEFRDFCLNQR